MFSRECKRCGKLFVKLRKYSKICEDCKIKGKINLPTIKMKQNIIVWDEAGIIPSFSDKENKELKEKFCFVRNRKEFLQEIKKKELRDVKNNE